jgi:glycogen synthase
MALVVRLHTPGYLVDRLTAPRFGLLEKARFALGALRRWQWPRWPAGPNRCALAFERLVAHSADCIAAPCNDIARIVGGDWSLQPDRLQVFAYPFESTGELDSIAPPQTGLGSRILFVGRLEPRKGVQYLGPALRLLHRRFPDAVLRCVGAVWHGPVQGERMDAYLRRRAGASARSVEIPGPQPRERLREEFASADVCVFPSLWENFPYVCLEAMTAARAVVGSTAGGMAEMLTSGAGVLVEPGSPRRWADAIGSLLADGLLRRKFGETARDRVRSEYSYEKILPRQLACYEHAITFRRQQGPRNPGAIPPRPLLAV